MTLAVQTPPPGNYVIEHVERIEAANSIHAIIPPVSTALPAVGAAFTHPITGYRITRISDVLAAGGYPKFPKSWNGLKGAGLHNGYSHYSCANRTGEYVLAFGTTPLSILYRLSDYKCLGPVRSKSGVIIGDQSEPRWTRRMDEPATVLYYHVGAVLYKQDALRGPRTEEIIYNFGSGFVQTDDNELSNDGRYGCYRLSNGTTVVVFFYTRAVLAGKVKASTGGVDIWPAG
jgi:hypothetical protein